MDFFFVVGSVVIILFGRFRSCCSERVGIFLESILGPDLRSNKISFLKGDSGYS